MKKAGLGCIVMLCATTLMAQGGFEYQEMEGTISLGMLSIKNFQFKPMIITFGVVFDFHAFDFLMISPELMGIFDLDVDYSQVRTQSNGHLGLGLSFNYTPGYPGVFYFGAGVFKRFVFRSAWEQSPDLPLDLKLNAGIRTHNRLLRLSVYFLTPFNNLFKSIGFGIQLGYGIFKT